MMGATTINRLYGHAEKLRDVFTAQGVTADQAETESHLCWQLAASVARVPEPDELMKARTVEAMRHDEQHPDPFEGLGF